MAAGHRSARSAVGSGANVTLTEPAGAVSGDVIYGLLVVDNRTSTVALPEGWNELARVQSPSSGGNGFIALVGRIVRGGSAPSYVCANPSVYREWHVIAVQGADTSTPEDATALALASTRTLPYNPDPPSATPADERTGDLAIAFGVCWAGSAASWAHSAYTIRSDNTAGNDGIIATRVLSSASEENPDAFSGAANADADGWSGTILVRSLAPTNTVAPAVSGTPTEGETLAVSDGSWTDADTFAYQWRRDTSSGYEDISGETAYELALTGADVDAMVRCRITATGPGGTAAVDSDEIGPIEAADAPPPGRGPTILTADVAFGMIPSPPPTFLAVDVDFAVQTTDDETTLDWDGTGFRGGVERDWTGVSWSPPLT